MARDEPHRLIVAWRTNSRATAYLVEHLPSSMWSSQVPGIPRLTVRMIAAHIHNSRCRWIKSLGAAHGVKVPRLVDLRRVQQAELVRALSRSSEGMVSSSNLASPMVAAYLGRPGRTFPPTWSTS